MNLPLSHAGAVAAGALLGAVFGVAFGAFASVFEGGPTLAQGVAESWYWFSAVGAAIAFGTSLARRSDRTSRPL